MIKASSRSILLPFSHTDLAIFLEHRTMRFLQYEASNFKTTIEHLKEAKCDLNACDNCV